MTYECVPHGCRCKHKIGGIHLWCNPKQLGCPSSRSPSPISVLVLHGQARLSQPPEWLSKILSKVLLWHGLVSTWLFWAQMILQPGWCRGQFLGIMLHWLPSLRYHRRYAVPCKWNNASVPEEWGTLISSRALREWHHSFHSVSLSGGRA